MRLSPFAALFSLVLFPVATFAQSASPFKGAVIDAAQADEDFGLQGEYVGYLAPPGRSWQPVGLQIVALGNGKFDAVLYDGGLPGAGWDGRTKEKLSGGREAAGSFLRGVGKALSLASGQAAVFTAEGRELGTLALIHRESPTMGAAPPSGATVLFNGNNTDQFTGGKLAPDGTLLAGVLTKMPVHDFHMHLEFRTPYMPQARGQGRGNSGVYIQQRYEVQILDSFGLYGVDNECGGLYKQTAPAVNMCLPPLAWQTYDIWFTAAQWASDGKTKVANARITVLHNGVLIHSHREITAKTGGGKVEGPEDFPINLQDHGNPVTFRNIWLVNSEGDAAPLPCPAPRRLGGRHRYR
jgi:3-keto-disaccharide hydrolase